MGLDLGSSCIAANSSPGPVGPFHRPKLGARHPPLANPLTPSSGAIRREGEYDLTANGARTACGYGKAAGSISRLDRISSTSSASSAVGSTNRA